MVGGQGTEVQEGQYVCIHIADSLHGTAETNTKLLKKKKKTPINKKNETRSISHWFKISLLQ